MELATAYSAMACACDVNFKSTISGPLYADQHASNQGQDLSYNSKMLSRPYCICILQISALTDFFRLSSRHYYICILQISALTDFFRDILSLFIAQEVPELNCRYSMPGAWGQSHWKNPEHAAMSKLTIVIACCYILFWPSWSCFWPSWKGSISQGMLAFNLHSCKMSKR